MKERKQRKLKMQRIIAELKKHLPEIQSRFKVKEIGVFGSWIKGKAKKRQ